MACHYLLSMYQRVSGDGYVTLGFLVEQNADSNTKEMQQEIKKEYDPSCVKLIK